MPVKVKTSAIHQGQRQYVRINRPDIWQQPYSCLERKCVLQNGMGPYMYRGSAADSQDSQTRPAARNPDRYRGTRAAGGSTAAAESFVTQMGDMPRVPFGRRQALTGSRAQIGVRAAGSFPFQAKSRLSSNVSTHQTQPAILARIRQYVLYPPYAPARNFYWVSRT